jgi:hypothetical protein
MDSNYGGMLLQFMMRLLDDRSQHWPSPAYSRSRVEVLVGGLSSSRADFRPLHFYFHK